MIHFLTSFPILLLCVAGLTHVIELSRLAVSVEQASFFAARSALVDQDPSIDLAQESTQRMSEWILGDENESLELLRTESPDTTKLIQIRLAQPNTPLLGDPFRMNTLQHFISQNSEEDSDSFLPKPELKGSIPLPEAP